MTSCYDVIKDFDFLATLTSIYTINFFFVKKHVKYVKLHCLCFQIVQAKSNYLLWISYKETFKNIVLFSREIAIFEIYDDASKK